MFDDSTHLFFPRVEPCGDNQFKISPELNQARLRQSLLYFEKVLYVPYAANLWAAELNLVDPDVHWLLEQGIVDRLGDRVVRIPKLNDAFFKDDATSLFLSLNRRYPDHQFITSVPVSEPADVNLANSIYCRINDSLPVPAAETGISEIVAFRTENREKLLRFGNHIDMLGLLLSSDTAKIEKVVRDLDDNLNRLTDSLASAGLYGGKADFSFSRILTNGARKLISAGLEHYFGLGEVLGSMLAASVKFSLSKGPVVEASNSFPRTYEYLIDAGRQRIFKGDGRSAEPNDWLYNNSNDSQNTLKLTMPPEDLKVQVIDVDAEIRNNVLL